MEKSNSLGKTLKDNGVGNNGTAVNSHVHHPRLCPSRTPWASYGSSQMYGRSSEDNYLCGISWPPRSYACSFCKREFRSAQALGGHMNVHRRDRARLRQSSPTEDFHHHQHPPILSLNSTNPSPSPNPNPNAMASSTCPSHFASSCPLISQSSAAPSLLFPASGSLKEVKGAEKSLLASWRSKGTASKPKPVMIEASIRAQEMEERYKHLDNNTEMDLLKVSGDAYIDLELRLGCP